MKTRFAPPVLALVSSSFAATPVKAQDDPSRLIRLVMPHAPGISAV